MKIAGNIFDNATDDMTTNPESERGRANRKLAQGITQASEAAEAAATVAAREQALVASLAGTAMGTGPKPTWMNPLGL